VFNLTQQERQVILFLATIALIGVGIDLLARTNSGTRSVAPIYCQDLGKINLNTADKELLMSISGIGQKLAQRIVEYRQRQGGFKEKEELKNIKGITESKFEKIKDSLILK